MDFSKSPPELVARFGRCLPADPAVVRRQMFGWPAAFVNERMFASLHRDAIVVRRPDDDAASGFDLAGTQPFEPMPGRPMTGYIVLPEIDDEALRDRLRRAFEFVRGLPPKKPKAAAARRTG